MSTAQFESAVSTIIDGSALDQARSFATLMVQVDVARDCEQRVQLDPKSGPSALPARPAGVLN